MPPSRLMPPSAINGTRPATARRVSTSASTCGTPKFVVSRVVQPPPGPMPTLIPLTPRSRRNCTPAAVATFPATISTAVEPRANLVDRTAPSRASGHVRCR